MRGRIRALTALLLIAVLHSGVAMPSAADLDHALPADAGMMHDGEDGEDCSGPDCCDPSSCDCGCAATHTAVPKLVPASRDWPQTAVVWPEDTSTFPRAPTGVPFRPPA